MISKTTGEWTRAMSYIARKEDFQKAITDQGHLSVIAVYSDGQSEFTQLLGYIKETRLIGHCSWEVVVDGMMPGRFILVTVT